MSKTNQDSATEAMAEPTKPIASVKGEAAVTARVAQAPAPAASQSIEQPAGGGSFVRQADGTLVRNPDHPEPTQQLVRRPYPAQQADQVKS
jgi:hypothetical protein